MAIPIGYKVAERGWNERGNERTYWHRFIYAIPKDEVETYRTDFTPGSTPVVSLPGGSGLFSPRLADYTLDTDFPGRPGKSRVVTVFRTPTWGELVREEPNRAILEVDISGQAVEQKREKTDGDLPGVADGRVIAGPDQSWLNADDPDLAEAHTGHPAKEWRVVSGSNVIYEPKALFRVTSTAENFLLDDIKDLIGKMNNTTLVNFGNIERGRLLFLGVKASRQIGSTGLWSVSYLFWYDENGWEQVCQSQLFVKAVATVFKHAIDGDGELTQSDVEVGDIVMTVPDIDSVPETRYPRKGYGNFAFLEAQLEWYNE